MEKKYASVQFSSVTQSCPTLCDPMNHSMADLPVPHQLPESTQNDVHWVRCAIQPSHPRVVPFSSCLQFSHIRVFSNESALHMRWSKYWSFSFNISPSNEHPGWSPLEWTSWSLCSPRASQESSPTPQFKSINSSALSFLYCPTLTPIHDYWKKP